MRGWSHVEQSFVLVAMEMVLAGSSITECRRGYSSAFVAKAPLASTLVTQ